MTLMVQTIDITATARAQAASLRLTIERLRLAVHHGVGHRESADGCIHSVVATADDGRLLCVFYESTVGDETAVVIWWVVR